MRILVLGKDGQVGRELQRTLLPLGEVVPLGRREADLENLSALRATLDAQAPDVIVNAAAYTAVDKAESDERGADQVNHRAVEAVADYASRTGALLVHYSTDYVFDGQKSGPYVESDPTNPQNVYGRTKRAGEEAVLGSGCKALIFRTSWVYAAHGHNFIKTILRLAAERERLEVVADQHGAPSSAELIADVTALALACHRHGALADGIYHMTASGDTTWHGLARHVLERAIANGAKFRLDPVQVHAIPTEAYPLPAARPKNSCLDSSALSRALGLHLPDWKIHVDRVVDQLTQSDPHA